MPDEVPAKGRTFADLLYVLGATLYNNKQSILGGLVAALAFVQAYPQFRDLVDPKTYEWMMFGIGLVMVFFARSAAGGAVASRVMPSSVPTDKGPPPGPPAPPEGG